MSGIYDNSDFDRYHERELDDYLDPKEESEDPTDYYDQYKDDLFYENEKEKQD